MRQEPCLREKLVIRWKLFLHFVQISSQVILSCYLIHSRKVVDLLERLHFLPFFEHRRHICPLNIPLNLRVPRILVAQFPAKVLLADFFDYFILRIVTVEHDPRLLLFLLLLLLLGLFILFCLFCFWTFLGRF